MDIFEAARLGETEVLKQHLNRGVDLEARNKYGFTALHCAAMGCNTANVQHSLEVMRLLLKAGCALETEVLKDGRTALYLAAEFSFSTLPIQFLLDAGANADIVSSTGVHIVKNAMELEVQQLLSDLTGVPIPPPRSVDPEPVKMGFWAWRIAKRKVDKVFRELSGSGLLALQDAGYTQSDGYEDCAEKLHAMSDTQKSLIIGVCFYTRQDLERARKVSALLLAFCGFPENDDTSTQRVGQLVVDAFSRAGFRVIWDGCSRNRPTICLAPTPHH